MKHLRASIVFTLFFVIVTGFAFPAVIYALSQSLFPHQANGSLVTGKDGSVIGSGLIGQNFTKPEFFHPRPSAAGSGYDAANSSGTNLGPTSDKLINGVHDPKNPSGDFDGVVDLAKKYRMENGLAKDAPVPVDAVTRSASGLDPDISVENAMLQARRVAAARHVDLAQIESLIREVTQGPFLSVFGPNRVNVLRLNVKLAS
jgi:potassium-transporting ATPase KdpC subunit